MKKITFTLVVTLLMCMIITLVGYNELTIRNESKKFQEINKKYQNNITDTSANTNGPSINCIGDSMLLGTGSSATPSMLSNELSMSVNTFGGAYDQSIDVSIRLGKTKVYVSNITIPSSVEPVNIDLYNEDGDKLDVLKSTGSNFTKVEIAGISGKLKYDTENKKHTFTRDQKGEEKSITKPTQIKADFPTYNKDDIAIIFTGTYDKQQSNGIFRTITYQRAIINQLKTKKYIIISLTSKRNMSIVKDNNDVLREEYDEHFLDFRTYLLEDGLKDAGMTPTSQDKKDLQQGYIPTSLLQDDLLHGNSTYHKLLTEQLIKKMKELKYIS